MGKVVIQGETLIRQNTQGYHGGSDVQRLLMQEGDQFCRHLCTCILQYLDIYCLCFMMFCC